MKTRYLMAFLVGIIDGAVVVYLWHIFAPEAWQWLSDARFNELRPILYGVVIGYIGGYYHGDILRWLRGK